jgi:hypothetical protein
MKVEVACRVHHGIVQAGWKKLLTSGEKAMALRMAQAD